MKIGELADEVGLSTKAIRYYESIDLLPEPERTASGYRDYGSGAADRLSFIKQAQGSGLTLAEIGSILEIKDAGGQSCEHTRALLRRHLDDLDRQLKALRRQRLELARLYEEADTLDPSNCTDAHRCQVIANASSSSTSAP